MALGRRDFLLRGATLAAFGPTAARAQTQPPLDPPLNVVATTSMIADAARRVAGDAAEVRGLMGPGVDPHGYRQTRSDIQAMARADLTLWHGLFLEAQLERFFERFARTRPVAAVAETGMPRDLLLPNADYADRYDPHVWMAPELWTHVVVAIRDALIAARPAAEAKFRANAEAHLAEIAALAVYARDILRTVPEDRRVLVTAHDAFRYFGRAYGFEVEGIQGISTNSEAGLQRIEALVEMLVARRIGAAFVESSVSDRNIRALIEGAAARGHEVTIGAELYSDSMGRPGTYEGTYLGMIDANVTAIARALGGAAPERGRLGRLAAAT